MKEGKKGGGREGEKEEVMEGGKEGGKERKYLNISYSTYKQFMYLSWYYWYIYF